MDKLDLIDEVEIFLKKKLDGIRCIRCGGVIVEYNFTFDYSWNADHSPYIEVSGEEIVAGYRCREDPDNPVIVFRISRSRSDRGRTRVYE
jgi:hypothetical protein